MGFTTFLPCWDGYTWVSLKIGYTSIYDNLWRSHAENDDGWIVTFPAQIAIWFSLSLLSDTPRLYKGGYIYIYIYNHIHHLFLLKSTLWMVKSPLFICYIMLHNTLALLTLGQFLSLFISIHAMIFHLPRHNDISLIHHALGIQMRWQISKCPNHFVRRYWSIRLDIGLPSLLVVQNLEDHPTEKLVSPT